MARSMLVGLMVAIGWLTAMPAAHATKIPYCMQVVPSGEIVIRYGETWCRH